MTATGQQDVPTPENQIKTIHRSLRARACRRGCVLAIAIAWGSVASGCDCHPPRSKPWRHASDPDPGPSEDLLSSDILAAEKARIDAHEQRSHTMRVHVDAKPRHLNPLVAPTEWTLRITLDTVFETLVRYQPPEGGAGSGPGRYQTGLARSWQVSPNGREIRIDLQPEVKFHDGHRMSAVDVQFSLDAARHPRSRAQHLRAALSDVVGVDLVGPRSLRIRLSRVNGFILRTLAEVPILPARVYEGKLGKGRGPVVGTGPYQLESWKDGVVHLSRFEGYWGSKPAIPDIEFVYEPDAARALTAAKRNELDFVPAMIPAHYPEQASAPGLASTFVGIRLRPLLFRYLAVDTSEPPLDDVRVRHAIALLLDRKALIKKLHDGMARAVAGPVWPGGPGDGASPAAPGHDPAEAGRLLDLAGWRDTDRDGRRERGGEHLRVSLLALEDHSEEREVIVKSLRRSGFMVDLRRGGSAVLLNRLRAGDFDLCILEWRGSVDQNLAPLLETGGSLNFGGYSDRRADKTLASLRAVWEPASRAPLMSDLAATVAKTWPLIPLTSPDPYGLLHKRIHGAVVWNGWISLRNLSFDESAE